MGKAARLRNQRRIDRARQASALRVTVVSHPDIDEDSRRSSSNEVALVRAAVLYADTVELSSQNHYWRDLMDIITTKSYLVADFIVDPSSRVVEDYIAGELIGERYDNFRASIDEAMAKHQIPVGLTAAELRSALRQAHKLDRVESEAERKSRAAENGLADIRILEAKGLLKIIESGLNWGTGHPGLAFNPVAWQVGWWEELQSRIEDGSTRLLFDQKSQSAVRAALDSNIIKPSTLFEEHSNTTLIGAGLIARLPAFPEVPLDELLDLRADLSDPLMQYRVAANRMSKASGLTIGPDSRARLDDLWINEVEPAIRTIKDQMHDHGLPRELARSFGQDIQTYLTEATTLGLGFGTLTDIAGWANAIVAVGAPGAHATFKSWQASGEGKAAARRSDLFYLYEARRRLIG